jgi:predicted DNA-binding ribbon-helix-helix protein
MSKTTIRLSDFTQARLRSIAESRDMSLSQLLNEIALQYIGAIEGAEMMAERAAHGSKRKALRALRKVKAAGRPPIDGDGV